MIEKKIPAINFIGKVFERLTVIGISDVRKHGSICFLTKCLCGNEKIVSREHLLKKDIISCGCYREEKFIKAEDFIGYKSGKLIITKLLKMSSNGFFSKSLYEAKCNCGRSCKVTGKSITDRKSCGCLIKEIYEQRIDVPSPLNAIFNYNYSGYRSGAISRKLEFKLSKIEFISLVTKNCHYCNKIPSRLKKGRNGEEVYLNGIDRKNNKIGYIADNCVTCCTVCNRMKHTYEYKIFLEIINEIYNNRIKS